jgi:hypothetical protein
MLFKVKVVDRAQYDAHLAQLANDPEGRYTGPAVGDKDVNQQAGLQEKGTSE